MFQLSDLKSKIGSALRNAADSIEKETVSQKVNSILKDTGKTVASGIKETQQLMNREKQAQLAKHASTVLSKVQDGIKTGGKVTGTVVSRITEPFEAFGQGFKEGWNS